MDWVKEVKHQIGKHDRAGLQILSENIASIIEKEENTDLKTYFQLLNENLSKDYKRGIVVDKRSRKIITLLEQMDLVGRRRLFKLYDWELYIITQDSSTKE